MKISIAPQAEQELIEGALFYAQAANPDLGQAFVTEFERCVELLRNHPQLGAIWRGATRRLPLRRFPYSVVYQSLESEVRVLAVAHAGSQASGGAATRVC